MRGRKKKFDAEILLSEFIKISDNYPIKSLWQRIDIVATICGCSDVTVYNAVKLGGLVD